MPVTKTEAIRNFLLTHAPPDLAGLYGPEMEVQVSVARDGGERAEGEFKGRAWSAWTNGQETWKNFRIPLNANSEPTDNDGPMNFDLQSRAEGVGMTGWDWKNRLSRWVGFDFDAIVGHAENHQSKLTDDELSEIRRKAEAIPWVTVRKSTSGNGIHLYVFLAGVPTDNHTEHAALARSILGQMSAVVGFDFQTKVDAAGAILWVWHRKMVGTDGLTLLKSGEILRDIPPDWRDHVPVVSGKRRRTMPQVIQIEDNRSDRDRLFDELTGQQHNTPLDAEHNRLIDYLRDQHAPWSWSSDHHSLTTHTYWLKQAHTALGLKGPFETISTGKDRHHDINCFCFPLRNGAWVVRRHGNSTTEASTWSKDRNGYSRCFLNRDPNLIEAAQAHGASRHKRGGYAFQKASDAAAAAKELGVSIDVPDEFLKRPAKLIPHKDGGMIFEVERISSDDPRELIGWNGDTKTWHRIFDVRSEVAETEEVGNYDNLIRHLVTDRGEDAGWVVCSDRQWRKEPKDTVKDILVHLGVKKALLSAVIGSSAVRPWTLVKVPFAPEYIGDRNWNRNAPRLKYSPSTDLDRLRYPTWMKILKHVGQGLDDSVAADAWCQSHGIATGSDYLKCWIASLFQAPLKPLPYLFLYSLEQNTGKSILAEALELIIMDGVIKAKQALMSSGGFNGELETKVLCIVEEGDLKGVKGAYEKIKEWVNSPTILIHPKGVTPYQVANTTHWIHTSNDVDGCPIDPQDSRITMIKVEPIDASQIIPKEEMFRRLVKEAPDFLAAVLTLEIPPTNDRLNIPVIDTDEKRQAAARNLSLLEVFINENMHQVPGATVGVSDFYEKFIKWLDPSERASWTRRKVSTEMPPAFPKGRLPKNSQWAYGNLSFEPGKPGPRLTLRGETLREVK